LTASVKLIDIFYVYAKTPIKISLIIQTNNRVDLRCVLHHLPWANFKDIILK
jgi:hypothetical protein